MQSVGKMESVEKMDSNVKTVKTHNNVKKSVYKNYVYETFPIPRI